MRGARKSETPFYQNLLFSGLPCFTGNYGREKERLGGATGPVGAWPERRGPAQRPRTYLLPLHVHVPDHDAAVTATGDELPRVLRVREGLDLVTGRENECYPQLSRARESPKGRRSSGQRITVLTTAPPQRILESRWNCDVPAACRVLEVSKSKCLFQRPRPQAEVISVHR